MQGNKVTCYIVLYYTGGGGGGVMLFKVRSYGFRKCLTLHDDDVVDVACIGIPPSVNCRLPWTVMSLSPKDSN